MNPLPQDIKTCRDMLLAVTPVLPRRDALQQELADAQAAQERGYYLPDEDDRVRRLFAEYLDVRSALLGIVARLEPWVDQGEALERKERLQVFTIGFTAACYLLRCAQYMTGIADGKKVVIRKLNEAEPRFNIPRKAYTKIYRSQSSVSRMFKFHEAWRFYDENRESIHALKDDPVFTEVVDLLEKEEPFIETKRRDYWKRRLRYRIHSFRRRNASTFERSMFGLMEMSGRTIAELRDPTAGLQRLPKRADGTPYETAEALLEPGDIIISRHRDALSNLFLPGFWPHGSLYVGEMGGEDGNVAEARKDGVLLRPLHDTLSVDAFLILRAKVSAADRQQAARRSLKHIGKLYDFAFDFRQSERLACTALIYRSWHNQSGVTFELIEQSGRLCLPAESLIEQALESETFHVIAYFGPHCEAVSQGREAEKAYQRDQALKTENPTSPPAC